jgi:membrane protein
MQELRSLWFSIKRFIIESMPKRPLFFFKTFLQKILKDEILVYAQGLSFNTILTLIPLLGLILSIAKVFIPQEKIIDEFLLQVTQYLTPEATQKVTQVLIKLIKKLETFPLGKFSVLFYFIMSVGLLFQIEDVLNKIFESTKRRSFYQRLLFFWLCITLTPFIFLVPFIFSSYVGKFLIFLNFLFMVFFFLLIYLFFPAKDVPKKEALVGAVFSTCLWFTSSYLYSFYVKYAVSYSKIYGSLAAFPLFLLWIFLNWVVFLIGAELIVFLEKRAWESETPNIPRNLFALFVMYLLGKNFYSEGPIEVYTLCQRLKICPIEFETLLQQLENQGLVVLKEGKIYLIKAPEKISLLEILTLENKPDLKDLSKVFPEDFIQKLSSIMDQTSKFTLKDLLN